MNLPTLDSGWAGVIATIGVGIVGVIVAVFLHFGWITPATFVTGIIITALLALWYLALIPPIAAGIGIGIAITLLAVMAWMSARARREPEKATETVTSPDGPAPPASPPIVHLCVFPTAPDVDIIT